MEINEHYLGGFFDGEGSISIYNGVSGFLRTVSITQKRGRVLFRIRKFLSLRQVKSRISRRETTLRGGGKSHIYALNIGGVPDIMKFIDIIEDHVIVKKKQVEIMKKFCVLGNLRRSRGNKIDEKVRIKMIELSKELGKTNRY